MKKTKKIVFALIALIALSGVVFAASHVIDKEGTLSNVVNGNSTSRTKIYDDGKFAQSIYAYMTNIKDMTGENAAGGIRVKTMVKSCIFNICKENENMMVPVFPDNPGTSSGAWFYKYSDGKYRVQWENWTGNTSLHANFVADNK